MEMADLEPPEPMMGRSGRSRFSSPNLKLGYRLLLAFLVLCAGEKLQLEKITLAADA